MKVIEKAKNSVFPMKVRCEHKVDRYGFSYGNKPDFCGWLLEIEESDVKKHPWFRYPDDSGVDYGIICPVCHMFTPLDENMLPRHVKERAREVSLRDGRYEGSMENL